MCSCVAIFSYRFPHLSLSMVNDISSMVAFTVVLLPFVLGIFCIALFFLWSLRLLQRCFCRQTQDRMDSFNLNVQYKHFEEDSFLPCTHFNSENDWPSFGLVEPNSQLAAPRSTSGSITVVTNGWAPPPPPSDWQVSFWDMLLCDFLLFTLLHLDICPCANTPLPGQGNKGKNHSNGHGTIVGVMTISLILFTHYSTVMFGILLSLPFSLSLHIYYSSTSRYAAAYIALQKFCDVSHLCCGLLVAVAPISLPICGV